MPASPAGTTHPAVTAPQLVGVLASAAAIEQRSWPGISSYIGHQSHAVNLVWLHDGEMLVCTFSLLPVRLEQAPWKDAISAAVFGTFICSGVNDLGR